MTKPEPLKGKILTSSYFTEQICIKEDIRSAVYWLLDNIGPAIDDSNGPKIFKLIIEAFADVMKAEEKED